MRKAVAAVIAALLVGVSSAAAAQPAASGAQPQADASGQPQFYLLSLPEAPIAEASEAVAGGLGQTITVDPGVDGTVTFSAEGWYTPDALLREFGSALLDRDLALVRDRSGELGVVLAANRGVEEAKGAQVLAVTAAPLPAIGPAASGQAQVSARYGDDRGDGPWGYLLAFFAGAAAMGAGVWARPRLAAWATRLRRPALEAPVLQISFQPQPVVEQVVDPELAVPERPKA